MEAKSVFLGRASDTDEGRSPRCETGGRGRDRAGRTRLAAAASAATLLAIAGAAYGRAAGLATDPATPGAAARDATRAQEAAEPYDWEAVRIRAGVENVVWAAARPAGAQEFPDFEELDRLAETLWNVFNLECVITDGNGSTLTMRFYGPFISGETARVASYNDIAPVTVIKEAGLNTLNLIEVTPGGNVNLFTVFAWPPESAEAPPGSFDAVYSRHTSFLGFPWPSQARGFCTAS